MEFFNLKGRLLWRIRREEEKKKFLHSMRDKVARKRQEVKRQHAHQVRAIRIEVKQEVKIRLPKELKRYKDCNIFKQNADKTFKPGTMVGPVIVGVENILLDEDELSVLCKGPEFRRILSKERYLVEAEKSFCKLRYEMFDDDPTNLDEGAKETQEEKKERERVELLSRIAELDSKTVFNEEEITIDYGRKRAITRP